MHGAPDPTDPEGLLVLHATDAQALGRLYSLEASPAAVTIGRAVDNTIVLRSDVVSRRHARFEARADGWWVIDAGSSHGTFVNEARVTSARLCRGDHVRVGDTILKFVNVRCARGIVETEYTVTPLDGLTELFNRRHLIAQIDAALREAGRPLALALFDIDRFKAVNDAHGHLAGDRVLQALARLLQALARPGEVLARCAGDKFALLLPGTDREGAAARAERIGAEIAGYGFEAGTIAISVSWAVAEAHGQIRAADDLLRAAERERFVARGGRASS